MIKILLLTCVVFIFFAVLIVADNSDASSDTPGNGGTDLSDGAPAFGGDEADPAGQDTGESPVCEGGSSAGGLRVVQSARTSGMNDIPTGPAIFETAPAGLEKGGGCFKTSSRSFKQEAAARRVFVRTGLQ